MLEFFKKILKTQICSIIYSVITITFVELIIREIIQHIWGLFFILVIGLGILSFLVSKKYFDTKWLTVILTCLPYGIYCLLILALYGSLFPISSIENDYGIGFRLLFGLIGCWVSITIGMIIGNILSRTAIHGEREGQYEQR